jgi:predicted DNA-binding transcriptional regulator YafY
LRTLGTRQGITIGELAEEFGVTKRSLYRDIKALEEAGYPLLSEAVDGTLRPEDQQLKDGRLLLSMTVSGKEGLRLRCTLTTLYPNPGSPYGKFMRQLWEMTATRRN